MPNIAPKEPVQASSTHALVCASIAALGAAGIGFWILRSPRLASFVPGYPMVFDTGLCFLLNSAALWISRRPDAAARRIRTVLVVIPMLLCIAVLIELLLDTSLWIDFEFLQKWYDYGNTRPGRMAPNTAIGFIFVGAGILLADRVTSRDRGIGAVLLTFCVLAIGLTGLVGYALTPDLLFEWTRSARMAIPTAIGLILCSVGMRQMWSQTRWYISHEYFREDEKIRLLGPATLAVATITAALSGVVLQQEAFRNILSSKLQNTLHERSVLFATNISRGDQTALSADRLVDAGRKILLESHPSTEAMHLLNEEVTSARLRGIAIENGAGVEVRTVGKLGTAQVVTASLGDGSELLWDGELIIRRRTPVLDNGNRIGFIISERSAGELDRAIFESDNLGKTGEIVVCTDRITELLCFPGNRHSLPYALSLSRRDRLRLPMQLALAGQTGEVVSVDYRGQNVIAAYGMLAPGLGIVVKQDAVELYAVIRQSLQTELPLIIIIALAGTILLYLQLKPLAAQLLASEASAIEQKMQLRTVIETVADGILTFDAGDSIEDVNQATCEIFGYEARELLGERTRMLMPEKYQDAMHRGLHEDLDRGLGVFAGQRDVRLSGRRKDGSQFPLELTIRASSFSGRRSFVGIVRDITERKESERRLRESSHQAGMAEIAIGVLHNVGNVLNSLGIANATARRELKTMRLDRLEQATNLLSDNRDTLADFLTTDERGRHLIDFLSALLAQIAVNSRSVKAELDTSGKLIDHLNDIVSAQQGMASISGRWESLSLRELFDSALLVYASNIRQIEIVQEFDELPNIMSDRHKLLQILINLLSNARDAVLASNSECPRILLKVSRDGDHVLVTVEDSGIGMSKEVLTQIWRFGFTTKERGHGFGLHNSANAAHEIGATLTAHSDGIGHGSRFVLRLPIDNPDLVFPGGVA